MKSTRILITATLALLATPLAIAQDSKPKPAPSAKPAAAPASTAPAPSPVVAKQVPSYPMTTCVACGKALPEHPVEYVKGNRLYRLDAEACQKAVDSDAAGMAKKIDEAVIAQQKATYPLKTSPVSDKALEAGAVDHVYGTRLVRLASAEEVAAFEKDPAAAMAKVDKALIDSQLASYTMKKCPVSGEDLGEGGSEPVNYLYGTKLVRFCCKKCPVAFEKDPAKYMKAMAAK